MADPHDMKAAESTYNGFIAALKWSVPLLAIAVLIIIMIIA